MTKNPRWGEATSPAGSPGEAPRARPRPIRRARPGFVQREMVPAGGGQPVEIVSRGGHGINQLLQNITYAIYLCK